MKNRQKKISAEEKLDVKNWLEEGEQMVDIHCIVTLTHSSVHTRCGNKETRFKL